MQGVAEEPLARLALVAVAVEVVNVETPCEGDEFGGLAGEDHVEVELQVRGRDQVDVQRRER